MKDLSTSYLRHRIKTHLLVGVFIDKSVDVSWEIELQKLSNEYSGTSISFLAFESGLTRLMDLESINGIYRKSCLINYLKCARILCALLIWASISDEQSKLPIINIADLDMECFGDYEQQIQKIMLQKNILVSYGSDIDKYGFPERLKNIYSPGRFKEPYKTIKAGFTSLRSTPFTRAFLDIYKFYSIGPNDEPWKRRLFMHWYGDQISLLMSLDHLKTSANQLYNQNIAMLNMDNSIIVSTNIANAPLIYMHKGDSDNAY